MARSKFSADKPGPDRYREISHWHLLSSEALSEEAPYPDIRIKKLSCNWQKGDTGILQYLDNYDQHIRLSKQCLFRHQGQYHLAGEQGRVQSVSHKVVDFAGQLEEADFRASLSELIGLRKLESVLKIKMTQHSLALRDEEQKCVARANLLATENALYISAESVRGYDKAYKQFGQQLQKLGFRPSFDIPFVQIYQDNLAQLPAIPTPKKYKPTANDKLGEAVCKMCVAMIENARSHEAGIVNKSEDTEYLHDYRVSLRKTRSLVSLVKTLFPEEQQADMKQRLADIMRPTNLARDLDVYLLEQSDYEAMLPENLREGLPLMFDDFRKQHTGTYKNLKIWLSGKAYDDEVESCKDFFTRQTLETMLPDASRSVADVINKLVQKKYRKIIRLGELIEPSSPDEVVHDLRLECKKFRYLLDFFGAIYPKEPLSNLLKKLKKMQNTLGLFNDYSVQQDALHQYLDGSCQNKKIHISVGALILVLAQKQIEQRKLVEGRFAEFASDGTAELIQQLTSGRSDETPSPGKTKNKKKSMENA